MLGLGSSLAQALPAQYFGLSSGADHLGNEVDWNVLGHSGIRLLHLQLKWNDVQPTVGSAFTWTSYDTMVIRAARRDITILPYLFEARESGRQFPWEGSTEYADWATWVTKVTQRYGVNGEFWAANPSVPYRPMRVWEVWNEPNLAENNPGGRNVQPSRYARFLNYTYQIIRRTQPYAETKVLFGGLFAADSDEDSKSIADFLRGAWAEAANGFDGLSIHPYALNGRLEKVRNEVRSARTTMDALPNGPSKTLWVTELGWPVAPATYGVSAATQAALLTESFDYIKSVSERWFIKSLIWYFYYDVNACGECWDNHAGLRDAGGGFRPSWWAFLRQTGAPTWPAVNAPKIYGIAMNGTGSGWTEVHPLNGATAYSTFINQTATALGPVWPTQFQFVMGDITHDGIPEVIGISMNRTGSGWTEVHPLNGATNYTSFINQTATALGPVTPEQFQFVIGDITHDGNPEIIGVAMNRTGSGMTEVHPLNGATGFRSFVNQSATALGPVTRETFQFVMGDYNADGYLDLYAIAMNNTGSGHTEVHVLEGRTGFSTFATHSVTPLPPVTRETFQFALGDYNRDGFPDLYALAMNRTGTGMTEAHIINGINSFATYLEETPTAFGPATSEGWRFAMP